MCAVLLYSTAAAGINEGITATAEFLRQKLRLPAKEFTEKPTKVFKGSNPRRDEERSGWWTPKLKADRAKVKMDRVIEKLGDEGIFASIEEFSTILVQGNNNGGGGDPPPGEGGGGSGGSGGSGGAGGAGGNGGTGAGMSGLTNSNTGNNLHTYPVVGWTSLGDSGIGITLYHSSRDEDEGMFGMGWSSTYEARLDYTSGSSAIVKLPDGLEMPYAEASGVFTPPAGIHSTLVHNSNGSWTMTHKDGSKFEFRSDGQLSQQKDPNGNATTVNYNTSGVMTSATSADGRTLNFTIGSNGKISAITDWVNRTWTMSYDSAKNLTGLTYPQMYSNTYTRGFTYNSTYDILTETDLRGKVWSWTYDAAGKMLTASNPLGHTTSWSYGTSSTTTTYPGGQTSTDNYSSGLLASRVDTAGFSTSYTYDADRNALTKTDERGKVWTYTYDAKGNVLTATNPLGKTTTVTYNTLSKPLTVTDPLGNVTTMTYNSEGRLLTVVNALGKTVVTNAYDSYGQNTTSTDALSRVTTRYYNSVGDNWKVVQPSSVTTEHTYNMYGQPATTSNSSGNVWQHYYDVWARHNADSTPLGSTSYIVYNENSQVSSVVDQLGNWSYIVRDDAGRVTSTTNPKGETETYAYNSNGLRTSVTNGRGKTRTYQFTARGEAKKLTMPDGAVEEWSFSGTGQTTAYTSPLNYVINYAYDDAGKQTGVDYPTGTDTALAYDNAGRRTSMVDGTGTSSWTLNAASQVTQLATPQGTQTYAYNDAGQRTSMTEVGLGTTTYQYDSGGRMEYVTNRHGETTRLYYDTNGNVTRQDSANNTYQGFGRDADNRLISTITYNVGWVPVTQEAYTYNAANQMTAKVKDGVTTSYAYDLAGQLTSEGKTGYSASYTYDANGNRLSKTLNGTTESYTYDDGDKMLTAGSKSYTYDAAGRTTSVTNGSSVTNLAYDYESRLTSLSGAQTASYAYNGLDTRVSKIEGGTTTDYVRDGVGVTAPVIRDTFASYTPGVSERRGSTSTFSHSGLKNAETQTSSSSTVVATKSYDAFGNQLASTGTWSGAFGYAGDYGYQEDASGLKLLGHRYYDSSTGRFLTRDPARDGRNWYVYCNNNPIINADPTGFNYWLMQQGEVYNLDSGRVYGIGEPGLGEDQRMWKVGPWKRLRGTIDCDEVGIPQPDGTVDWWHMEGEWHWWGRMYCIVFVVNGEAIAVTGNIVPSTNPMATTLSRIEWCDAIAENGGAPIFPPPPSPGPTPGSNSDRELGGPIRVGNQTFWN